MALPIYVSLEQIDPRLLEAAKDLYASSTQAFLRVTLPLSAPGIVAGTLLTFIPAAGDFINAALLGTPNQAMIGNVIQAKFLESLDYPSAAALSFILMGSILVALLVYARIVGIGEADGMTTVAETLPPRARPASPRARGVREAPRAHRVRAPRGRLPDAADRRRDPLLLQQARRAASTTSGRGSRSTTGSTGTRSSGSRARSSRRSRSALLATIVATALGTLIAMAIVRHQFVGRGAHERARLPADVDAGDRPRRVAPDALPEHDRGLPARVL